MATVPIRKAVISAFGDVSNLSVVEAELPPTPKGQLQLQVLYSGFNGADIQMLAGRYPLQRSAPLTPGYCFVGRVISHGPGTSPAVLTPGAIVAALTAYEAEATRINVSERFLVPLPAALADSDEGQRVVCALILDWTTAVGMVRRVDVRAGQRVFIHGLSGAVGGALVRLCLLRGAKVYGTASARNHAALAEIGVAKSFVYTDKEWMRAMKEMGGAHAVFDPLGFESWDESYDILAEGCEERGGHGILVGYGGNKGALAGDGDTRSPLPFIARLLTRNLKVWSKKRTAFYYIDRNDKTFVPDLRELMTMVVDGKITVPIKGVWSLETESLREAHKSWGKMEGMGSLLIHVDEWPVNKSTAYQSRS